MAMISVASVSPTSLAQAFFHQFWSGTRMQVLDDLLENGNTMRPIVNQFAHGSLLELA